jgi:hypothetical protein
MSGKGEKDLPISIEYDSSREASPILIYMNKTLC